jgi:3-hydroxy-9,10-secoandrosta-1,3,5(10)-triene-9,17-dione monooxygenase
VRPDARSVPDPDALIDAARGLIPMLRRLGPQHDAQRRLSDEAAAAIREAGFFRICQSVENGGYGLPPSVLWRVAREIARGDTSTAWVLSLAGLHPWMAGMFPVAAQDEVFEGGRDAIVLSLTGNVGRDIEAVRVEGGVRLSGRWTYASGIDVADWAAVLADVPTGAGATAPTLLLVPRDRFRIDHDSWQVFGMQGTGSKDVRLEDEFVPEHRTLRWADVQRGDVPGRARNRGPMYDIPHTSLFVMSVAAPIAAVATGLLDVYVETVRKRTPAGLRAPQVQDAFSLAELGKAASRIHMAFDRLVHDVDEMWHQAVAGTAFTVEQRARYRMDGATICDVALEAGDALVRNLGGSLLPVGPVERYFRDLHAMASHFLMQANPSGELYGRALLGLELPPNARI